MPRHDKSITQGSVGDVKDWQEEWQKILEERFKEGRTIQGIYVPASKTPSPSPVSAAAYIKNLRVLQAGLRATSTGLIDPRLQTTIATTLAQNGLASTALGDAIASGALTISGLEADALAGEVAPELHALRGAIEQLKSTVNTVPRAPSVGSSVVQGAIEGGVSTKSWVGAAVGAVGGFLGGSQAKENEKEARHAIANAAAEAEVLASPEHFQENMAPLLKQARVDTVLASQAAQLAAETGIEKRGLRGTGVGAQMSISGSVASEIAALRTAARGASDLSQQEVATKIGMTIPVKQPNDNLIKALTAAGTIAGQYFSPDATNARKLKAQQADPSYTPFNPPTIQQPTYSG